MRGLGRILPLTILLAVTSCGESVAPAGDPVVDGPRHLRWSASNGPIQFSAVAGTPKGEQPVEGRYGFRAGAAGDSVALNQYFASFWAVRGERRYVQINYVNASGDSVVYPFLRLSVAEPTQRPNGTPVAEGDSVLITVAVDPVELVAHLEPSGLLFGNADPTELRVWYTGANGDFNGDGVVDQQDEQIESSMLGMWYQEGLLTPWQPISATQSAEEKWFGATLEHFSGYAISW